MRKSSLGQMTGRLSAGPLRVKNDGGGPRKSTVGSHTPQGKLYSGAASARPRSTMGHGSGMGQRGGTMGLMGSRASGVGASGVGIRNSGIGVRSSGIGVRSQIGVPKDPRPVSDKSYQHRCIRALIDFLTDTKYPHAISQKLLLSPPSKEFFKIFEHIYCQIDPAFKMGGKMEEEVPRCLKNLGYPFQISKSSMHAVGTPHTWPYLLAALIWLVDLVKFTQGLERSPLLDRLIFPPDDDDFDSIPDDKIKFQYFAQTYTAFLDGADQYDIYDEELGKVLEDKYLGQSGGVEAVRNENARIAEEIALLDQEMGRVDKLQEQQEIMLLDERKFRDYLAEVENVIRKHQQMLHDAAEEHSSLQQDLHSVLSKNQHMWAIHEQQELTPADVERLRAARQQLQRQEEGLEREVQAIDADIWKEEMGLAKHLEQLNSSLAEYSKLARALRLIPHTTDLANGINFELRACTEQLDNKFDSVIKPALVAMKKKGLEAIQQLESSKLSEESSLEQYNEQVNEVNDDIAQLTKDIKAKDDELLCRKQLYQRDIEGLQGTVDHLEQEIRTLLTSTQMSLQDAERELRQTYSWAEQKREGLKKKEQEHATFMTTVCNLVADHKTHVQQQLKSMERDMSQVLVQEQERAQRMENYSAKLRHQLQQE
ncbi:kinetochore protein NDC80 homolog [Littorina saxatilis]|uniref:Kinetochore protein NDC80 n=1 Tax=Littorina saxatilis TaxID=31220 RepID=A0AAN9ANJ3_9CAEN